MTKFKKRFFPQSTLSWKMHLKIFLPIFFAGSLFSLNGFVDNFMVGHIPQGVTALSAVNSWTNIYAGIQMGVTASGSIILAQFYYSKRYETAREIARIRFLISFVLAICLSLSAWIFPDQIIGVFLKKSDNLNNLAYANALESARSYLKIIAIQWLLISLSGSFGDIFSELKYGFVSLYWGIGTLLTNIILNSILMYGIGMDASGAAWASVASRVVAILFAIFWLYRLQIKVAFKPWTIFSISRKSWKLFLQRWLVFFSQSTIIIFITFRNYFYDAGYPVSDNSKLGQGLSAMMILGLSGAIQNVFISTFSSVSAMAAIRVGSEQGNGNLKQAKINSDMLKGFNTSVAISLSVILAIVASFVPYMTFLSNSKNDITIIDHQAHLLQVRNSLYVIAAFFPIWIWFITSMRNGLSGGRGLIFAILDWVFSGPVQLSFLAIIVYFILPNSELMQSNFAIMYALFFVSDIVKAVFVEIFYFKSNWLHNLVSESKA